MATSRIVLGLSVFLLVVFSVLILMDGRDSTSTALIEVDNQSGTAVESIEISWGEAHDVLPGVESGQSALIPIEMEQPGTVSLTFPPLRDKALATIDGGQRFYVRLLPAGIEVEIRQGLAANR